MDLDFEIELLDLVQERINRKFSNNRKIGETPVYGAALQQICEAAEKMKDQQHLEKTGSNVRPDHISTF